MNIRKMISCQMHLDITNRGISCQCYTHITGLSPDSLMFQAVLSFPLLFYSECVTFFSASNCTVVEQLLIYCLECHCWSLLVFGIFLEYSTVPISSGLLIHAAMRGTEWCHDGCSHFANPLAAPCHLILFVAVVLNFCLAVCLFVPTRKQSGAQEPQCWRLPVSVSPLLCLQIPVQLPWLQDQHKLFAFLPTVCFCWLQPTYLQSILWDAS